MRTVFSKIEAIKNEVKLTEAELRTSLQKIQDDTRLLAHKDRKKEVDEENKKIDAYEQKVADQIAAVRKSVEDQ